MNDEPRPTEAVPMRSADGQEGPDMLLHVLDRVRNPQPSVSAPVILPTESAKIGPFLRDLRKRLGVTQAQLVSAGVGTQGTISSLENGYKMPLFPTVVAYLAAMGCVLGVVRTDGETIPDDAPIRQRAPRKPDTRDRQGRVRRSRAKPITRSGTRRIYDKTANGRCLGCFTMHKEGQVYCA